MSEQIIIKYNDFIHCAKQNITIVKSCLPDERVTKKVLIFDDINVNGIPNQHDLAKLN